MKKTTKKITAKPKQIKPPAKKSSTKKRLLKQARPIHKKFALHPISVFFMLCVGVLLVASTIYAAADSYTVAAVVPLPPAPTSPPTITSPSDGQSFNGSAVTVTGNCPTDDPYTWVYVGLILNGSVVGYGYCNGNVYSITTNLPAGGNVLMARVFDSYGTAGPNSGAITLIYNAPPIQQPTTIPIATTIPSVSTNVVPAQSIEVLQVDNNVPYVSGSGAQDVSYLPTITGIAPPFSHVVVTIHSNPIVCETNADSQGFWSCTITQSLPAGIHHVFVVATTMKGVTLNFKTFQIVASTPPKPKPVAAAKFNITTDFKPTTNLINQNISFNFNARGGVAPYAFNISWGDGSVTEVTRITAGPFTVNHTYSKTNGLLTSQTIKIEGIDSQGNTTSMQIFTKIKNPAYTNIVSYVSQSTGLWSVFSSVKSWLWVIWPGYLVVVLMMFSFWLGERQELMKMINRHYIKPKLTPKKH